MKNEYKKFLKLVVIVSLLTNSLALNAFSVENDAAMKPNQIIEAQLLYAKSLELSLTNNEIKKQAIEDFVSMGNNAILLNTLKGVAATAGTAFGSTILGFMFAGAMGPATGIAWANALSGTGSVTGYGLSRAGQVFFGVSAVAFTVVILGSIFVFPAAATRGAYKNTFDSVRRIELLKVKNMTPDQISAEYKAVNEKGVEIVGKMKAISMSITTK